MKRTLLKVVLMLGAIHAQAGEGADIGGGDIDLGLGSQSRFYDEYEGDYVDSVDYGRPESYCEYTSSSLNRAVLQAVRLGRRGNFPQARAALIGGIQNSLRQFNRWQWDYKPLTREALERALELDRSFNNNCGDSVQVCQADRRSLRFLVGYLEHIRNNVIPFETEYHIPYRRGGWERVGWDWEVFVSHYKDVAISLLQVYTGRGPDNQMPLALGNDIFELRVATKLFSWASYDLRRDDLNRSYRCEIRGLRDMSFSLADHLRNGNEYDSNRQAVEAAGDYAVDVLNNIESYSSCRRW
jgi:hypothetical protein